MKNVVALFDSEYVVKKIYIPTEMLEMTIILTLSRIILFASEISLYVILNTEDLFFSFSFSLPQDSRISSHIVRLIATPQDDITKGIR